MTVRYQRPRTGGEREDGARRWPERIDLRISVRIDLRTPRTPRHEPPPVVLSPGNPLLRKDDDEWVP